MSTYQISGRVVGKTADAQISGLRVEAWDESGAIERAIAHGVTNSAGQFDIVVESALISSLIGSGQLPRVYFRVVNPPRSVLANTCGQVTATFDGGRSDVVIRVGSEAINTTDSVDHFEVTGQAAITGSFSSNIQVRVYDVVAAGADVLLGSFTFQPGSDGRYRVTYSEDDIVSGKNAADVRVDIHDTSSGSDLASSEIHYQAASSVVVDVSESGASGTSLFSTIKSAMTAPQGSAAFSDIAASQPLIQLVASSARTPAIEVEKVASAEALTSNMTTGAPSAQALYALMQEGGPKDRDQILRMPHGNKRTALEEASSAVQASITIGDELNEFRDEVVARMKEGSDNFDDLVAAAGLSASKRDLFMEAYATHEGTIEDFWSSTISGLTTSDMAAAKKYFKVGAAARYHLPLVNELAAIDGASEGLTWETFEDLAKFLKSEWTTVINGITGTKYPAGIADEAAYADLMYATMASAYPTLAMKEHLEREKEEDSDRQFFIADNPTFDFRQHRVKTFISDPSNTIVTSSFSGSLADVVEPLEKLERLLRLTPRPDYVAELEELGIGSAAGVVRFGRDRFVAALDTKVPESVAEAIYAKAQRHAAAAEQLALLMPSSEVETQFESFVRVPTGTEVLSADWTHYFGEPQYLSCDRCSSVHGPAAYLVDTLVWLDGFQSEVSNKTALDLLVDDTIGRRTDIANIELTCETTEGRLPYIDLVNEVLEYRIAVMESSEPTWTDPFTTEGTEDQRLAIPDNQLGAASVAYATLEGANYPWKAPFEFDKARTRAYLEHLGVPRDELMRILADTATAPTDDEIAQEHLRLSPLAVTLISNPSSLASSEHIYWGLNATEDDQGSSVTWDVYLERAQHLIDQAHISYPQLLELTETKVADVLVPAGLTLSPAAETVKGDLSQVKLEDTSDVDATVLHGLQSILRFHHATGWPIATVDKVMQAFGPTPGASKTLTDFASVADAHRVAMRLSMPLVQTLAFWKAMDDQDMPISEIPSEVTRVFRDPALGSFDDAQLLSLTTSITDQATNLRAALGLNAADYNRLISSNADLAIAGPLQSVATATTVTMDMLAKLYRYATLAKVTGLTMSNFLVLDALAGATTFASPAATLDFLDKVELLETTALSAADIHYLTRHIEAAGSSSPSRAQAIAEHVTELETETAAIVDSTRPVRTVSESQLRGRLVAMLDASRPEAATADEAPQRDAAINADVDALMALIEDVDASNLETNRTAYEALVTQALASVFDDVEPFKRFLVPEDPSGLSSCVSWFEPDNLSSGPDTWTNAVSGGPALSFPGSNTPSVETDGVVFDGSNSPLTFNVGHTSGSQTVVVGCDTTSTSADSAIAAIDTASTELTCLVETSTGGAAGFQVGSGSPVDIADVTAGPQTLMFAFDASGSGGFVYRDGQPTSVAAGSYASVVPASTDTVTIGGGPSGGSFNAYNGKVSVVGVFDGDLDVDDKAQVNGRVAVLMGRVSDRRTFMYNALVALERSQRNAAMVKLSASNLLSLDEEIGAYVLDTLESTATPSASLADDFAAAAQSGHIAPSSGASTSLRTDALTRLNKVALLVEGLDMDVADLEWLLARTELGWLDLNALPIVAETGSVSSAAEGRFAALLRLVETYALADHVDEGRTGLYAISALSSTDLATVAAEVERRTRWTDVEALHTALGDAVGDFSDLQALRTRAPVAEALRRLGVDVGTAEDWIDTSSSSTPTQSEIADAVTSAARARHTPDAWADVARPIRDVIRAEQRDALVDYLVVNDDVSSPEELYEKLLIDIEMSPCALTSRVRAAMNSVQLFVHRALFGLEPDLNLDKDAAQQWEWRKSYVLWEANRKVFIYPENWIEPELRDDKTPFFEEFEAHLREGEVTDTRIRRAYEGYVQRLNEVARLDVIAMFHEQTPADGNEPSVDRLHVFAQGRGASPRPIFYRRRDNRRTWTPWQQVEINTDAKNFAAYVENGRLHFFWAEVSGSRRSTEGGGPPPGEVRLGHVMLGEDGWNDGESTEPVPLIEGRGSRDQLMLSVTPTALDDPSPIVWVARWLPRTTSFPSDLAAIHGARVDAYGRMGELEDLSEDLGVLSLKTNLTLPIRDVRNGRIIQDTGFRFGNRLLLTASDVEVSIDRTAWIQDVPRGSFFVDAGGHSVFIEPASPISAYPADYDTPPEKHGQPALPEKLIPQEGYEWSGQTSVLLSETASETMQLPSDMFANHIPNSEVIGFGPVPDGLEQVRVHTFEHRMVNKVRDIIGRNGLEGVRNYDLLSTPLQEDSIEFFNELSPSTVGVVGDEPVHGFDFSTGGAYSQYNWELFFHIPLMISQRCRDESRYQDAIDWLHAIFDPRDYQADATTFKEIWKFKPFRDTAEDIANIRTDIDLSSPNTVLGSWLRAAMGGDPASVDSGFEDQLRELEADPFSPHKIARLRQIAYQKAVIRLYAETLLDWGDMLFARDTTESIVEAQQLYVQAGQVLGKPRPLVDAPSNMSGQTFGAIRDGLDGYDSALGLEAFLVTVSIDAESPPSFGITSRLLFCTPPNEKQRELWAKVQDRLFKIRNCMNIDGVVRELPLFQPPIDPALLVRARAAGLDINQILSDLYAPPPLRRFGELYQRALDFSGYVVSLGQSLLSALEKKDGEHLAALRSGHEVSLLKLIRETKVAQVDEAQANLDALKGSKLAAEYRRTFYQTQLDEGLLPSEQLAQDKRHQAGGQQDTASRLRIAAGAVSAAVPNFNFTFGAVTGFSFGGGNISSALNARAEHHTNKASRLNSGLSGSLESAGHQRRTRDWTMQRDLADEELRQIDRQIVAAEIRLEIVEGELENHDKQREQAAEVNAFYSSKYTNKELYSWMARELSGLYYEAYQMAFRMARRAERAFQYERADFGRRFITFGYFEGSRKGLLAGERLQLDLRRMEEAYVETDRRDLELTKHVSMAEFFPDELVELRKTGSVEVVLDESHFDLDYPGHYLRRLKSVGLTLPAVSGPHTSVNCTLTLLTNKYRSNPILSGAGYAEDASGDTRFNYGFNSISSVCTSSGVNDTGMFELNFRDERLLPFEGAGAASRWRIELPQSTNRFDLDTLSDVVLHVQYMARDGGGVLRAAADTSVTDERSKAKRLISLKDEFPDAWTAFMADTATSPTMTFNLSEKVPFIPGEGSLSIPEVRVAIDTNESGDVNMAFSVASSSFASSSTTYTESGTSTPQVVNDATTPTPDIPGTAGVTNDWTVTVDDDAERDKLENIHLVVEVERV